MFGWVTICCYHLYFTFGLKNRIQAVFCGFFYVIETPNKKKTDTQFVFSILNIFSWICYQYWYNAMDDAMLKMYIYRCAQQCKLSRIEFWKR